MSEYKLQNPEDLSDFVKSQIEIAERAEKMVLGHIGSPIFMFTKQSLNKRENIGFRQNRRGENVMVVEDLNGNFIRMY